MFPKIGHAIAAGGVSDVTSLPENHMPRDRADRTSRAGRCVPVTVLAAPGGYGKTVLLQQYLSVGARPALRAAGRQLPAPREFETFLLELVGLCPQVGFSPPATATCCLARPGSRIAA